ncbi:dihydrolipoamide acetyltransferase family protein [Solibacillus sp. CAU 1738]|uniref:dihydrolipoamide acetyltransferase family protein n=1 Tax=Solibacillus sp. CAU 1738 TaxID=3140363 RepID=UPI003260D856
MFEVKLYDIGEGLSEATINHYYVKIGDFVSKDQSVIEVQTDKMAVDIPSPTSGVVRDIFQLEGDTIPVGTVMLMIESTDGEASNKNNEQNENNKENHSILASPSTRNLAKAYNVDITKIRGSGAAGRVMDQDVLNSLNNLSGENQDRIKGVPKNKKTIAFDGNRKKIAQNIEKSIRMIPHVTHFEEIDVTRLIEIKEEVGAKYQSISFTAFFVKAAAMALEDFPIFNSKLDEELELIYLIEDINIGIATDTQKGLLVPVIKYANKKSVKNINSESKELVKKARGGKLPQLDVMHGTFTISNVGMHGSIGATPIINYPQTALLALHKTKKTPVVGEDDKIHIRSIMTISFSFDHRVADGVTAVTFTNRFKEILENPNLFIVS